MSKMLKTFFYSSNGLIQILKEYIDENSATNLTKVCNLASRFTYLFPSSKLVSRNKWEESNYNPRIINIHIDDIGISFKSVANNFFGYDKIKEISFVDSTIGNKGVKLLCEYLKDNQSVVSIILHDNQITCKGAKYIASMLEVNKTLTYINLSWNLIGEKGIKFLSRSLMINQSLTKIDLSCNKFVSYDVKYLFESLKINKNIKHINLYNHYKNYYTIEEMRNDVLSVNKNIMINLEHYYY